MVKSRRFLVTGAKRTTPLAGSGWQTACALCLLFFCGPGLVRPARAELPEEEPPPAPLVDYKDAELHAKLASALYKAGNYLEAATELNVAYTLQPQPVYLFNIAQAYRKALRAQAAKVMYERFLEMAPNHALAQEARGYMIDMDALARAEKARDTAQAELAREQARYRPLRKRAVLFGVIGGAVGVTALTLGLIIGLAPRDPSTSGGIVDLSFNASF
jgi:tetratricopeptide (TPR) repeat protein